MGGEKTGQKRKRRQSGARKRGRCEGVSMFRKGEQHTIPGKERSVFMENKRTKGRRKKQRRNWKTANKREKIGSCMRILVDVFWRSCEFLWRTKGQSFKIAHPLEYKATPWVPCSLLLAIFLILFLVKPGRHNAVYFATSAVIFQSMDPFDFCDDPEASSQKSMKSSTKEHHKFAQRFFSTATRFRAAGGEKNNKKSTRSGKKK